MTDPLAEALDRANRIIAMMRQHLAEDHPDCAYGALGVLAPPESAGGLRGVAETSAVSEEGPGLTSRASQGRDTGYSPEAPSAGVSCACWSCMGREPDGTLHGVELAPQINWAILAECIANHYAAGRHGWSHKACATAIAMDFCRVLRGRTPGVITRWPDHHELRGTEPIVE